MTLLLAFAFIGGVVTILSPCILPILPIILSGSVTGGKKKPWGIVIGFVLSFTFFTLFLTSIVNATGLSSDLLRDLAVVVIGLFGLTLVLPRAQVMIERVFSKLSGSIQQQPQREGFGGGVLVGLTLGLIWTPCVGPILASVISLALTGSVTGSAFFITLAYSLGTAIPMLGILYGGRGLLNRVPWLLRNSGQIQKAFGVIMILVAIAIALNYDRKFQAYILTVFPNYGIGLTSLEDNTAVQEELDELFNTTIEQESIGQPMSDALLPTAPELIRGGEWFNSDPLTIAGLHGQVVLVDFWTYSCINCIRTLPFLNDWYAKYSDEGLVILGIHTPEFEFEKDPKNVAEAIRDFGIEYPVMQDNNFATWRQYQGSRGYWPRKFIVDHTGKIIYDHAGEGSYEETELVIREALVARAAALGVGSTAEPLSQIEHAETTQSQSPEVYFGAWRNELLVNGNRFVEGEQSFEMPETLQINRLAFVGEWNIAYEYAENTSEEAKVLFPYSARNVFTVARADSPVRVQVLRDGAFLTPSIAGEDIQFDGEESFVEIQEDRLYRLIEDEQGPSPHGLELIILESGLQAFTFTFG